MGNYLLAHVSDYLAYKVEILLDTSHSLIGGTYPEG
jgi:hypothetical protein